MAWLWAGPSHTPSGRTTPRTAAAAASSGCRPASRGEGPRQAEQPGLRAGYAAQKLGSWAGPSLATVHLSAGQPPVPTPRGASPAKCCQASRALGRWPPTKCRLGVGRRGVEPRRQGGQPGGGPHRGGALRHDDHVRGVPRQAALSPSGMSGPTPPGAFVGRGGRKLKASGNRAATWQPECDGEPHPGRLGPE